MGSTELQYYIYMLEHNITPEDIEEFSLDLPESWIPTKDFQEKITTGNVKQNRSRGTGDDAVASGRLPRKSSRAQKKQEYRKRTQSQENKTGEVPSERALAGDNSSVPAQEKETPRAAGDENAVNALIALLLDQCSKLCRQFDARWTMDQIHLEANFGEKRSFRVDTDGRLKTKDGKYIRAIIEAKKAIRTIVYVPTAKQEISEVVALIKEGHRPVYNNQ